MKTLIKKLLPKRFLSSYHFLFAWFANVLFRIPSKKLIIIGITGTKGKTSVANFVWSVLQKNGIKTGIISTANIRIGDREEENTMHMTMPGRFFVQKTLKRMVDNKCEVAIVETTSQGIVQFRHIGVRYDIAIFTNLTPEHIESHGSFENYKKAKGEMFKMVSRYPNKRWRGREIEKTIIANADDENSLFYLNFDAQKKLTYSVARDSDAKAEHLLVKEKGVLFDVDKSKFTLSLAGEFNVYNALPAVLVGRLFNLSDEQVASGLVSLGGIAGRMEEVACNKGFQVFVDYAHEPAGLESVIKSANKLKKEGGRSIVLLGAAGGGRDKARRPIMGKVAGSFADIVVVSDDEPYEEDPLEILNAVKQGALEAGKVEGSDLFVISDRREGVKKALQVAKEGDVVVFTGLGHQKIRVVGKQEIPWVEKEVVKEELAKF